MTHPSTDSDSSYQGYQPLPPLSKVFEELRKHPRAGQSEDRQADFNQPTTGMNQSTEHTTAKGE